MKRLPARGSVLKFEGCIATLRVAGQSRYTSVHTYGGARAIAELCDSAADDWRVLSYSTPATIYRDLQGARVHENAAQAQLPEISAFGRIGRLDLLDDAFAPQLPRGRTHA